MEGIVAFRNRNFDYSSRLDVASRAMLHRLARFLQFGDALVHPSIISKRPRSPRGIDGIRVLVPSSATLPGAGKIIRSASRETVNVPILHDAA